MLKVFNDEDQFMLIGYSFGILLTLKVAAILEAKGMKGSIISIDSSPMLIQKMMTTIIHDPTENNIQNMILIGFIKFIQPDAVEEQSKIISAKSLENKVKILSDFAKEKVSYSEEFSRNMFNLMIQRVKIALKANEEKYPNLVTTDITLLKAKTGIAMKVNWDYDLGRFCKKPVETHSINADNYTIIHSKTDLIEELQKQIHKFESEKQ